ncbi:MAG TPA: LUD domain-containing protein [Bacteroidota bacterium]|nr:LUD domain-containing protein [Bacteroidota bacterium]
MSHMNPLVMQFKAAAEAAVATVEIIPADAHALCAAVLNAASGDGCIILSEPDDVDPDYFSEIRNASRVVTAPSNEQFKTALTGVTDAFCGIASTGSVCVTMSDHLTSPAGMLTRKHIVALMASAIVARPSDVFAEDTRGRSGSARSFSFITGPSATADMGPLVRGVHGPGAIHIIVLDDSAEEANDDAR